MHLRFVAILPVFTLLAIPARGELPSFPYKAYVTADDVQVRSGPGRNYYPTDKLKMGQEVEVYRHDPGGWYAIRPPKGSFSWVSSRMVEIGKDGLATVTGDRVAARVGSHFSEVRDVIQIRLDRGELVEVLQSGQSASGEQMQSWCKIAPPSGEFRWVFGKYVDPDFPVDGVRKTAGDIGPVAPRCEAAPRTAPADGEAAADPKEAVDSPAEAARHSVAPAPVSGSVRPASPRVAAPASGDPAPTDDGDRRRPPVAMRHISPEEFHAEVDDIEMKLSVMVVEEPSAWAFGNLDDRAENLLAQADTAVERGRARLLVGKITRLADIKRRYDTVAATGRRVNQANASLADARRTQDQPGPTGAAEDRFDGIGRLTRVVSPKVGAPRYALVNEQGEVNCYVTPAPDVNLRHYEGQRIGVTGIAGLMLQPRAKHVAAKHVTLLDDRRLR